MQEPHDRDRWGGATVDQRVENLAAGQHGAVSRAQALGCGMTPAQRIPATRPVRTLVDCAAVLSRVGLMTVVDRCLCRGLTTPRAVLAAAARVSPRGNRAGLADLKAVLGVWTDGITPGSPAEMRLLHRSA